MDRALVFHAVKPGSIPGPGISYGPASLTRSETSSLSIDPGESTGTSVCVPKESKQKCCVDKKKNNTLLIKTIVSH